jgi:hypothetical protein
LWHVSGAIQVRDGWGRLRPKPRATWTPRQQRVMTATLLETLAGVGDQTRLHVEDDLVVSLQYRRPMRPAEGDPLEQQRRARRLGLVLP